MRNLHNGKVNDELRDGDADAIDSPNHHSMFGCHKDFVQALGAEKEVREVGSTKKKTTEMEQWHFLLDFTSSRFHTIAKCVGQKKVCLIICGNNVFTRN